MNFPRDKFVSDEEWRFSWYLDELVVAGIVLSYEYQPEYFLLSDEAQLMGIATDKKKPYRFTKVLLNQHVYTADFKIIWTGYYMHLFFNRYDALISKEKFPFSAQLGTLTNSTLYEYISYIDIKGSFSGRNNTSAITFPLNQKWVYDKYGIYVQKIVPIYFTKNKRGEKIPHGIFADTFTPDRYLYQDVKSTNRRALNYEPRTLQEFLHTFS